MITIDASPLLTCMSSYDALAWSIITANKPLHFQVCIDSTDRSFVSIDKAYMLMTGDRQSLNARWTNKYKAQDCVYTDALSPCHRASCLYHVDGDLALKKQRLYGTQVTCYMTGPLSETPLKEWTLYALHSPKPLVYHHPSLS